MKYIFIFLLNFVSMVCYSQVTIRRPFNKHCLALKINGGESFTKKIQHDDNTIVSKNAFIICPEITYNIIRPKSITEFGIKLFKVAGITKFAYSGIYNKLNRDQNTIFSVPLVYHRVVRDKKSKMYLNFGFILGYNFASIKFLSSDSISKAVVSHKTGFKYHVSVGSRYIFKIKNRSLAFDFYLTKGFAEYYNVNTFNFITQKQNVFSNRGTNACLSFVYFFKGNLR